MILAKNKYGQIGRQIPGVGLNARVKPASMGDDRGSVNISTRSIEADQAKAEAEQKFAQTKNQQDRIRNIAKRIATEARKKAEGAKVMQFQKLANIDPMNEKLKAHYARMNGMGESEQVASSLLRTPADFSQSGGNPQIVASATGKRPISYFADFRQELIVGNPLTRNGEYGPAVTDYDRYVNGVDVNQTDVVEIAGGTILGRLDGQPVPNGMAGMGFDFSWDGLVDAASNVISQTGDNLVDNLPDQLAKELQNSLSQGGKVTSTSGGTVIVQRPATTAQVVKGVPNWLLYAGGGLVAVGFLLILVKAVKK